MNPTPEVVDASYEACRRLVRRSRSNFHLSFLGLPQAKRRAMDALYAYMRHTDDLVDDSLPTELRRRSLTQWRAALARALQGRFDAAARRNSPGGQAANSDYPVGRELLPAVVDTVDRYGIPPEHLHAVIDGVETDLQTPRYESFDELEQYCQSVASAVGLACIHIWGFQDRQAFELARKCGIALQLTNILRDLKEDAQQGRVYLPLADLRQCDYSIDDLTHGVVDERFVKLMDYEIGRAEGFYREGAELIDWLEPDGRRIFGMIMATYRALLDRIKRRPGDVFAGRISLGPARKMRILARWTVLPPRAAALL